MSFFDYLANETLTQEEALRTASTEAIQEVNARYADFVKAYGEDGIKLISSEVDELIQGIADRHGVSERSSSISKAAWFGLTHNPLLNDRNHWTEEDWQKHYEDLTGGEHRTVDPNALIHRPGFDRRDPNDPAPRQLPILREAKNKYIEKRGNEWVILQKGTGKVLSKHDSEEKAQASFRAMEMGMHEGSKSEGTPSPKMDKRKWTPKTVGPLRGVDDPKGPNPTKHMDAEVEQWTKDGEPIPQATNKVKLDQIGEQRTEHYDLNKDKQKA